MRMIHIDSYDYDTMQLAKPVYDSKRRILLAEGRSVHPAYLQKIKELNISFLVVEDAESKGITLEEMLDMPTWMDTIKIVQDVFEEVKNKKMITQPTVKKIQEIAGKLLVELRNRKILVLIPTTSVPIELKLYAHSVNVALLSLQMGRKMGYTMIQLRDLAIGSLLHDIGKAYGDDQNHMKNGFEILRSVREFNIISAHVAFQHHEAVDGSGLPRGIKEKEFLEFAQICGAANYYENLISKEMLPPHEAMELIMTKSDQLYSHHIIQAIFSEVPTYPPGTKVSLSSGEIGIVYKIDKNIHRPTIRLSNMEEIALAEQPTILINDVYDVNVGKSVNG